MNTNPNLLDSSTCGIDHAEVDIPIIVGFTGTILHPVPIYKTITILPAKTYPIDGWWSFLTQTCTMFTDNVLSQIITIPSGTHLLLNGHQLTNIATITNQGTIRCKPVFAETCGITNLGTLINEGSLNFGYGAASTAFISSISNLAVGAVSEVLGGGYIPFSPAASQLTNYGAIENSGPGATISFTIGEMHNHGIIRNYVGGTIEMKLARFNQSAGASTFNYQGGTILAALTTIQNNGGIISNAGSITLGSFQAVNVPETKGLAKVNLAEPSILNNFNNGMVVNNASGFLSAEFNSAVNNGFAENLRVLYGLCTFCSVFNVNAGTIDNNGTVNFVASTFDNANGIITNLDGGTMYFQPWSGFSVLLSQVNLLYQGSALYNGLNATKDAPGTIDAQEYSQLIAPNQVPNTEYVCPTNNVISIPTCMLAPYSAVTNGIPPQALPSLPNSGLPSLPNFNYDEAHSEFINNGTTMLGSLTLFGSSGTFTNNGEIVFGDENFPTLHNIHDSLGVFNDYGVVSNTAEFVNYGNFTQECGASPINNYVGASFVGTGKYLLSSLPGSSNSLTNFYNETSSSCSLSNTSHITSASFPPITPISFLDGTSTSTTTTTSTTSTTAACNTSSASSCTSSTNVEGGSAQVDQLSSTGVYVQISGSSASNGTSVKVTSSDLSGQPSGTANIQLSGESFYDVNVSQSPSLGSNASATICINATSPSTTMEYWNGTSWLDAYDVTVSGNTVCGTVLVSALTGTPIVIGNPSSSQPPPMVDGNVTIFSPTDSKGEILFTANATVSDMHSTPFTESATPQFGTLPNGTYGYLGYYQGTFVAVSGGQKGANVSITVTYGGVSETGYALSPGTGNTTSVNFVFNSTETSNSATISNSLLEPVGISALLILATLFMVGAGKFRAMLPKPRIARGRGLIDLLRA